MARYCRVRDLLLRIKDTYGRGRETERDILNEMAQVDWLVLDEYAAAQLSDRDRDILQDLLDRRYHECRRTLVIANIIRDGLKDAMDDSTLSRLQETGLVLECTWPSFRAERAEGA